MNIDLDHARVGSDAKVRQARIARRLVAFEHDRLIERCGGRFHGGDEFEIIFQGGGRRHEDVKHAVSRFGADCGARDPCRAFVFAGSALAINPLPSAAVEPRCCAIHGPTCDQLESEFARESASGGSGRVGSGG